MPVDQQRVFGINARTGGFDLLPSGSRRKVFSPPRKRSALLGSYLVDVALFLIVQVDANPIFFPAFEHVSPVVGLPSVSLKPRFDRKTGMVGQPLGVIRGQVDDASRLIAAFAAIGLT